MSTSVCFSGFPTCTSYCVVTGYRRRNDFNGRNLYRDRFYTRESDILRCVVRVWAETAAKKYDRIISNRAVCLF
jgi:hypothetical protein